MTIATMRDEFDQILKIRDAEIARLTARIQQFDKLFEKLYADSMIAHRFIETLAGEHARGRDFAVKVPMAQEVCDSLRAQLSERTRERNDAARLGLEASERLAGVREALHSISKKAWTVGMVRLWQMANDALALLDAQPVASPVTELSPADETGACANCANPPHTGPYKRGPVAALDAPQEPVWLICETCKAGTPPKDFIGSCYGCGNGTMRELYGRPVREIDIGK